MKHKKSKKIEEDHPTRAEFHHSSTTQRGSNYGQGTNDLGKHADQQGSEANEGANYSNEKGWINEAIRKEDLQDAVPGKKQGSRESRERS